MKLRHLLLVPVLAAATGCLTHDATYKVSVENRLDKPVTLWLVKDNGPMQTGWLSPENVAELTTESDDHLPDVVLDPTHSANIGPLAGSFYRDVPRASLRIYEGTPNLTRMLATGRGGLTRYDQPLEPGSNYIVIEERPNGGIGAMRSSTPLPPAPPPPAPPSATPPQQ
jgi:hypothetical protein